MSFSPEEIQPYLGFVGAPLGMELSYTVDIYKLSYQTVDKAGGVSRVSGVMFIPQGLETLDLLSVQHGTVFKRDEVGSVNPLYALDGLIVAMNGYLVAEADYLGLGESQELHPYLLAEAEANPVIDMIRAVRSYGLENELTLRDSLFLAGYSEGGYVTLATQKLMESEYSGEFALKAVAPMAGPYDLVGTTRNLLDRSSYDNPAYLAYVISAYNDFYGWNALPEIFREPYASRIPDLVDGEHSGSAVNDQLTRDLDSLLQPAFKTDFLAGESDLLAALMENSLLEWAPQAPVRLIHGTADSTVFYANSEAAYESLRANGGQQVDLVPLSGADHASAAFTAYYLAIEWFDSLRTASGFY
jgi:pimeloyl-ACP methyl ester carboxylesterase